MQIIDTAIGGGEGQTANPSQAAPYVRLTASFPGVAIPKVSGLLGHRDWLSSRLKSTLISSQIRKTMFRNLRRAFSHEFTLEGQSTQMAESDLKEPFLAGPWIPCPECGNADTLAVPGSFAAYFGTAPIECPGCGKAIDWWRAILSATREHFMLTGAFHVLGANTTLFEASLKKESVTIIEILRVPRCAGTSHCSERQLHRAG